MTAPPAIVAPGGWRWFSPSVRIWRETVEREIAVTALHSHTVIARTPDTDLTRNQEPGQRGGQHCFIFLVN